ncbi:MAG: hypothetical protein WCG14_04480 [Chlamydiia bacterium]
MSGKKITDQQVKVYMQCRKGGKTYKIAAAQTGFSEGSAYNMEKRGFTEAKAPHKWRTRKDLFALIWDAIIAPLLDNIPYENCGLSSSVTSS